ncbi:MAG: glycosyltransferase [Nitrospirota bacterium]
MKKIVIFYASFGMGHKSAAMALKEHFKSLHGIDVPVVDFFERFIPGFNNLVRFLYDTSIKNMPKAYGTFFRITDEISGQPIAREIDKIGVKGLEAFLEEERPDAVIATFPISGRIEKLKNKYGFGYFVVVTDFGVHGSWIKDYIDLYFVADEKVKMELLRKEVTGSTIKVTGIPVREQFSKKFDPVKSRRDFGLSNIFTVLMLGKTKDIAKNILPPLCRLKIQVVAVAGRDERFLNSLRKVSSEYRNLMPLGFVDNVSRLMHTCDLMIGKGGGLTLSEALAAGLPMVIFDPIPGQEFFNVDFLVNEGAALYARDSDDLVQKIAFLSERKDRLLEIRKNALRLGRPSSSSDICKEVLNCLR